LSAIVSDDSSVDQEKVLVVAILAVVGGVDSRLRLGGLVRSEDNGVGTVVAIGCGGQVTVQFLDLLEVRCCPLTDLQVVRQFTCISVHSHIFSPSIYYYSYIVYIYIYLYVSLIHIMVRAFL